MLYREAGQLKTSYAADQAIFPITQDRWFVIGLLGLAALVPLFANEYWLGSILIPFLVYGLAALGLNILTGYAGQVSLGTAGFMAVGAYAAWNFAIRLPMLPIVVDFALAGVVTALVGIFFGLPSLRIKGFYLAVTTLAAQFFLEWCFTKFGWFTNYASSGVINAPELSLFGVELASVQGRYLFTLAVVAVLALAAKNLVRSATGRAWRAIRDMDVAATVIGIPPLRTKLLAFAVSSFYCGVSGALLFFVYLRAVEPQAFTLDLSFRVLFMIIIGGLGSILGSFLGAAFIVLLPILLNNASVLISGGTLQADTVSNLELIVFGGLIVVFLIVEPLGLARLWAIAKEKLRLWPFPH